VRRGAADPDVAAFLDVARRSFVCMQQAWDRADLAALSAVATEPLLQELKTQLEERGPAPNHTEVLRIEARLLAVEELCEAQVASVEFSGLIREQLGARPTPFRELWATQTAGAEVNKEEITVHQINFVLQQQRPTCKPEQAEAAGPKPGARAPDRPGAGRAEGRGPEARPRPARGAAGRSRQARDPGARLRRAGRRSRRQAHRRGSRKYYDDKPALFKERRIYNLQEIAIEAKPEQVRGCARSWRGQEHRRVRRIPEGATATASPATRPCAPPSSCR
jgi:hypothetical protein